MFVTGLMEPQSSNIAVPGLAASDDPRYCSSICFTDQYLHAPYYCVFLDRARMFIYRSNETCNCYRILLCRLSMTFKGVLHTADATLFTMPQFGETYRWSQQDAAAPPGACRKSNGGGRGGGKLQELSI